MNGRAVSILLCALVLSISASFFATAHAASSRACDAFARDYARNASRQGQVVRPAPSVDYSAWASEPRPAAPVPALPSAVALVTCREDARVKELPTRSIGPRTAIAWQVGYASSRAASSGAHCLASAAAVASLASLAGLRPRQMRPQAFSCCSRKRRAASGRCRIASWRQALAASCGFRS